MLNQTDLLPSKTFKFMEKYMEQLKEGHVELLREVSVQLWRKQGIPRYIQSFILKTKIANIEAKLAKWSVMVVNAKPLLVLVLGIMCLCGCIQIMLQLLYSTFLKHFTKCTYATCLPHHRWVSRVCSSTPPGCTQAP